MKKWFKKFKEKHSELYSKFTFTIGMLLGTLIGATGIYAATLVDSVNVTYDNSTSSLESENVQDALDELYGMCLVTSLSSYITNLYSNTTHTSVTTAGGESITQASDVGLMQDSAGNIRYYGTNPDNYVSFNDELWRIIGIFDVEDDKGLTQTRVKIMRSESIGAFAYDNKTSGYGTATSSYGSNNWSDARLMMLLNPGYEDGATDSSGNTIYSYEGSLYWNRKSGTCYKGQSDATVTCDFTSKGLGTEAKSLIGLAKYYLGANSSTTYQNLYADDFYSFERGTYVYSGHATTWTGYVGLIYASDYAYASDLSICTSTPFNYSSDSTNCGGNWMHNDDSTWSITSYGTASFYQFYINAGNFLYNNFPYYGFGVRPVVYLNADVAIASGSGTESDPYVLS